MKGNADERLDRLLAETEKLMDEMGWIEREPSPKAAVAGSEATARAEAMKRFRALGDPVPVDGYAEASVSADEMHGYLSFYPPAEGMKPLTVDAVNIELERVQIYSGVDWPLIEQCLFRCNTERVEILQVEVATGIEPVAEIPIHLERRADLFDPPSSPEVDDEKKSVDFKDVHPFVLVKKGEELARVVPRQPGVPGQNVRGAELPFPKRAGKLVKGGPGTVLDGERLVAHFDGTVELKGLIITVNKTLDLEADVDYSTGHIDFPGDVIIRGMVRDGFNVKSGASVYCDQTVDVSQFEAARDVVVKRGIIGRGKGALKAGGRVQAKFIENCYVEAAEGVSVTAAILNSHIYTLGRVELGPRGMIIGGRLTAQEGIVATQIGTATSRKAELICGIDYTVNQKLEWVRDQSMRIGAKLNETRRLKLRAGDVVPPDILELEKKLQSALHRMTQFASNLVMGLDKNEKATVMVRGTVYPGTYVEICHMSFVTNRIYHGVVFRLDKATGRIEVDPIILHG